MKRKRLNLQLYVKIEQMEHLLFIAAEKEELDCAKAAWDGLSDLPADGGQATSGRKIKVDFLLTGIGTTVTAYKLTKAILEAQAQDQPYTLIVEIGVAGSYDLEKFPVRSAAVISAEHFSDLGFETSDGIKTLFDYGCIRANDFPYEDRALKRQSLPQKHVEAYLQTLEAGVGVTVQTVTGNPQKLAENRGKFGADIESMEGAAVYYVALMEQGPFVEIRTVSNAVGVSDSSKWDNAGARATLLECCRNLLNALAQDL